MSLSHWEEEITRRSRTLDGWPISCDECTRLLGDRAIKGVTGPCECAEARRLRGLIANLAKVWTDWNDNPSIAQDDAVRALLAEAGDD